MSNQTRMVRNALIFIILLLISTWGCSPERKLAKKFVRNHQGTPVLIMPLYEIYKDNLTLNYDTSIHYTPYQLDSLAWVQSCFVQHVSDSIYLTLFTNSLIDEMTALGYDVYLDEGTDVFFSKSDPKWIIQLSQLQLNEDHNSEFINASDDADNPEWVELRTNTVTEGSWLEVSRTNTGKKQVLFLEVLVSDKYKWIDYQWLLASLRSSINKESLPENINYSQQRDSIDMTDVYRMAEQSGIKHATLLNDYFLNDFLTQNLPAGILSRKYFRYDRKTNKLQQGLKERFEVVE